MFNAFAREADRLVPTDILATAGAAPSILWADIVRPGAAEARTASALLGVDIPTLQEMEEIELSARLYEEDGALFMTVSLVTGAEGDEPRLTPVTFILGRSSLVTVRHDDALSFDQLRGRRLRGTGRESAHYLLIDLLDTTVDQVADALEHSSLRCDAISREVFGAKTGKRPAAGDPSRDLEAMLGAIGRQGDLLTKLRESLVGMARLLSYYSARHPDAGRDARTRVRTLQRDVQALTDHASFLSSKINFLLDATLGLINLEQNQIIKIFTVASVAFLPPTLIASIYGMNFELMPELRWSLGYPASIGLMLVSAALPFLYFRRRGWL